MADGREAGGAGPGGRHRRVRNGLQPGGSQPVEVATQYLEARNTYDSERASALMTDDAFLLDDGSNFAATWIDTGSAATSFTARVVNGRYYVRVSGAAATNYKLNLTAGTLYRVVCGNAGATMAYSATPPDFGSLCIQRQRWANGGLLILPKLWNQIRNRRRRGERSRPGELLLRINYMASICWASIGLILLLFIIQFADAGLRTEPGTASTVDGTM